MELQTQIAIKLAYWTGVKDGMESNVKNDYVELKIDTYKNLLEMVKEEK